MKVPGLVALVRVNLVVSETLVPVSVPVHVPVVPVPASPLLVRPVNVLVPVPVPVLNEYDSAEEYTELLCKASLPRSIILPLLLKLRLLSL